MNDLSWLAIHNSSFIIHNSLQIMAEQFFASSFLDPIMPDIVELGDKGVTFRVRKLIGGTDNFVFYTDISGVEIDNGLFFATIRVIPRARQEIVIKNFSKGDARKIKELILDRVPQHRPDGYR
jgi:Bacterial PH domain